jgi:hypothetical protein
MDSYRHVLLFGVHWLFAEHLESGGSVQKIALQCHMKCYFWEFLKSHSRTRESYLLLLKDLELFEGLSSTDCRCRSRIEPPLYAPYFWGTKHLSFFLKRLGCCSYFNSKFSACHLLMAIPSYGASRLRNFRYFSWWCNILGCWTLFL